MNVRVLLSLLVLSLLCLVPSFLLMGCESDDSPDTGDLDSFFEDNPFVSDPRKSTSPSVVSISPTDASVTFIGQQVSFTASGGYGKYTWDVANKANGTMSGTDSSSGNAVYTAEKVAQNDVIVYDSEGNAAVATINGSVSDLLATASPTTITVNNGLSILKASGGVPPYVWSVGDPALGALSQNTGNTVIYKRLAVGDNSIVVEDATGTKYSLVIAQP